MAKAMTAARDVCNPKVEGKEQAAQPVNRDGTISLPFLLAKNLLFWGSVSLALYGLYAAAGSL